jgi:hypothetical protein
MAGLVGSSSRYLPPIEGMSITTILITSQTPLREQSTHTCKAALGTTNPKEALTKMPTLKETTLPVMTVSRMPQDM